MSNLEVKTYGMAKTMLDEGWYTVEDLIAVIEGMGRLNQHARAQIDAAMLAADPQGLRVRPRREWIKLMRGVRVKNDAVVISVKGGNDAARQLCGALIEEMNR